MVHPTSRFFFAIRATHRSMWVVHNIILRPFLATHPFAMARQETVSFGFCIKRLGAIRPDNRPFIRIQLTRRAVCDHEQQQSKEENKGSERRLGCS